MNRPILSIENLHKHFPQRRGVTVHAVNGVDFKLGHRESVGLVGESGCGKSTTARCIVRLEEVTRGRIRFNGKQIDNITLRRFRPMRRSIQMVFQDPTMSLNPLLTVKQTLSEPLKIHDIAKNHREMDEHIERTMSRVKLDLKFLNRHPRQLSGGQKQRVGIARALITSPELVLLDEPTSSLDMSIRIHIINLLKNLQEELGLTYLFISHDLSTVRSLCHRVMVMYLGKVVEIGSADEIFDHPHHFYTRALLSSIPIPDPKVERKRVILSGEPPSLTILPPGCGFSDRCEAADSSCRRNEQVLLDTGNDHWVACWRAGGKK